MCPRPLYLPLRSAHLVYSVEEVCQCEVAHGRLVIKGIQRDRANQPDQADLPIVEGGGKEGIHSLTGIIPPVQMK